MELSPEIPAGLWARLGGGGLQAGRQHQSALCPCLCLAQQTLVYQMWLFYLHMNCLPPPFDPHACPQCPLLSSAEGESFSHVGEVLSFPGSPLCTRYQTFT